MADAKRRYRRESDERLAKLEEISPTCVRELEKGVRCRHKLNRHDPCSLCPCPGFVGEDKKDAEKTSKALMKSHADLFPKEASR